MTHFPKVLLPVIALFIFTGAISAQSAHKLRRSGDLMYDQREFLEAEEAYRKANEKEASPEATYNLGSAIYNQERYEEAIKHYQSAAESATTEDLKANAYFNLGNTYLNAGQLDKSIESYINSLKIRPDDHDTKKNLTLALQQLKQQQQQQQQQNQDQQEQQEQQEQQQQQSEGENEQQQQQQNQASTPQEEQQEAESQPQDDLSREEAEEYLRIIESEDQRVQEKLRKGDAKRAKPKKDW